MNHRSAARSHFMARMIERYNRWPTSREINEIRISVKNGKCLWSQQNGRIIRAIVPFRNIAISVVYNKDLDGMITAGCSLTGEIR